MERDGDETFAVDLFADVFVRADLRSVHVVDEDEPAEALASGLVSPSEARHAQGGLDELLELIEGGRLLPWLHDLCPFGPCAPPDEPPMGRNPVPDRLLAHVRPTW